MVLAAAISGGVTISIKYLSRTDPADRIVILTTLLWVPLSLPFALTVWKWPDAATWPWLILSGGLGTAGHYCWTRALKMAEASALAPLSYLQLLVVGTLAWLLFGEVIDNYTAAGAAIVIAFLLPYLPRILGGLVVAAILTYAVGTYNDWIRAPLQKEIELLTDLRKADAQYAEQGVDAPLLGPSPSPLCRWCDYRAHCPDGQQMGPEQSSWAALDSDDAPASWEE